MQDQIGCQICGTLPQARLCVHSTDLNPSRRQHHHNRASHSYDNGRIAHAHVPRQAVRADHRQGTAASHGMPQPHATAEVPPARPRSSCLFWSQRSSFSSGATFLARSLLCCQRAIMPIMKSAKICCWQQSANHPAKCRPVAKRRSIRRQILEKKNLRNQKVSEVMASRRGFEPLLPP